ncbi:MAG: FAD-dependent oxidoreductase, partial [Polyangiaceae bacterium]|nr:FAD-dependent oxidoreductase [Polyangiaceae bacterium]
TLRVVDDFDAVVLGVGVGAIPHVAREIVAQDPRWRAMVARVKGVASQAFQIWLRADMKQLGWRHNQVNLAAFSPPFETWADMRDLIAEESWNDAPRSLAYFCSVLPTPPHVPDREDRDYPSRRHEEVRKNVVHFLDHRVGRLWPDAVDARGHFRWDELVDAAETGGGPRATGTSRISSQFYTANVEPTGYYTLSLPGTSRYRISPLDVRYDNLTISGDWTSCGLNTGCIESAVMSGKLAAHAISRSPPLHSIVGYYHP